MQSSEAMRQIILTCALILGAINVSFSQSSEESAIIKKYELTTPHKSLVHSAQSIKNMKRVIKRADEQSEAYKCYLALKDYPLAQSSYQHGEFPSAEVLTNSFKRYKDDFNAAHLNAVMWAATGDKAHAEVAREILVGYSQITGFNVGGVTPLRVGDCYHLASALDLLSNYKGMTNEEREGVKEMFKRVYLPIIEKFYETPSYTNGNWGLSVTRTYFAIATICDDKEMYSDAVYQFLFRKDNGSLNYYLDKQTGQCQESGRDQGHVQFGLTCIVTLCEIARNQGHDLYGEFDGVILKGFEYTAKYLLNALHGTNYEVPYRVWQDLTVAKKYSKWRHINDGEDVNGYSEGRNDYYRPCWVVAYNHFVSREGEQMPYTKEWLSREGWGKNTQTDPYYFYDTLWFEAFQFNDAE